MKGDGPLQMFDGQINENDVVFLETILTNKKRFDVLKFFLQKLNISIDVTADAVFNCDR